MEASCLLDRHVTCVATSVSDGPDRWEAGQAPPEEPRLHAMARRQVTDQDRAAAKRLLLGWLINNSSDIGHLRFAALEQHIQHHTFPGEDFMDLAIDALDAAGIGRANPIAYETLLADHLPEIDFRGKEYRKIRFAVLSTAARRAGLEADLIDEVRFWNDDFWQYALYAAIALIRAAATNAHRPVPELARQLDELHQRALASGRRTS